MMSIQDYDLAKWGPNYWFKFRDSIHEVGKPYFSIVSNGTDEHPDPEVIRISDCKFNVFIDISCGDGRQEALERAEALCKVLNADYPFYELKSDSSNKHLAPAIQDSGKAESEDLP